MSGCCDDGQLHRFTESGIYQSSDDGGVTWVDDPEGDPRNDYVGAPPLPGDMSSAKRCAAADNVRGLFEQYRDNLIEIVGVTPTILAIIAGIVAFIGVLVGITGVGIGISVLFLTMAAEMIQIGGTGISGAITFTALNDFRCLVYCNMTDDGELTYDAWQNLLAQIAGTFSGFAETFFYQTVMGMGYIGVTNAGTIGAATAEDCGDCDCECQFTVNFEDGWDVFTINVGTVADGHLNLVPHVFELGTGYYCEIEIDLLEMCFITTLSVLKDMLNARPGSTVSIHWEFFDSDHVSVEVANFDNAGIADGTESTLPLAITPVSAQYVNLGFGWLDNFGPPNDGWIDDILINH